MDSTIKKKPLTAEELRKIETLNAMKVEALVRPRICYDEPRGVFKEDTSGYVPRKPDTAEEEAAEVFTWDASVKRKNSFYTLGCGTNPRKCTLDEKFSFPEPLLRTYQNFEGLSRRSTSTPSRNYALMNEQLLSPAPLSEVCQTLEGLSRRSTSKPGPKYAPKTLLDLNPGKDPKAEGKEPVGEDEGYVKVEMDEDEGYEMVEVDEAEVAGWEKV